MLRGQTDRFKHLSPVGFSKFIGAFKTPRDDSQNWSPRFTEFSRSQPDAAGILSSSLQHKEVGFSHDRMVKIENKVDYPGLIPSADDLSYSMALEYTYRMYRRALEQPMDPNPTFVSDASPGFPFSSLGYPDKAAAVKSDLFMNLLTSFEPPIALSTPKGSEALPIEDLAEGKLRTIFNTPPHLLFWQKFYFQNQNEFMKKYHHSTWGKYGYIKQYGGFHRLFSELLPYTYKLDLDVSGWDRRVFLGSAYYLRERGLRSYYGEHHPCDTPAFLYTVNESVYPLVGFCDGTVWRRPTGNNSGSNNTTTDNTLVHTVICFYAAIVRFQEVYGRAPSYEEVQEHFKFFLFGDDNCAGISQEMFESEAQIKEFFTRIYAIFGLVIKNGAVTVVVTPPRVPFSGISFLGSTARFENGYFVPYPRISKLMFALTSLMRSESSDDSILVDKVIAIWDLISYCSSTEIAEIKRSVSAFARWLVSQLSDESYDLYYPRICHVIEQRVNWELYLGLEAQ